MLKGEVHKSLLES
jgi:serine/threonine-protein kinase ULK/ATG1